MVHHNRLYDTPFYIARTSAISVTSSTIMTKFVPPAVATQVHSVRPLRGPDAVACILMSCIITIKLTPYNVKKCVLDTI